MAESFHYTPHNVERQPRGGYYWRIQYYTGRKLIINWRSIIVTSPSTYSFFCITIMPEQLPPWCWLIIMIEGHPHWLVFHYILIWDAVLSVFELIRLLTSNVWIWINTNFKRYYFTVNLHFFCANGPKSKWNIHIHFWLILTNKSNLNCNDIFLKTKCDTTYVGFLLFGAIFPYAS